MFKSGPLKKNHQKSQINVTADDDEDSNTSNVGDNELDGVDLEISTTYEAANQEGSALVQNQGCSESTRTLSEGRMTVAAH